MLLQSSGNFDPTAPCRKLDSQVQWHADASCKCLHSSRVAVQLPMFNERAVCQSIIDAACNLEWPVTALNIQVSCQADQQASSRTM